MGINVAIVEDDVLLRSLLVDALQSDAGISLVGQFGDTIELIKGLYFPDVDSAFHSELREAHATTSQPDVLVLDVWPDRLIESSGRMPDGTEAFTFLRAVGVAVKAVFVTSLDREFVEAACYAVAPQCWEYIHKGRVLQGSALTDAVKQLFNAGDCPTDG